MKSLLNFLFGALCLLPSMLVSAQETLKSSIIHDGIEREYILYIPDSYYDYEFVPLVINFHGYGSNAGQQFLYGDFRALADENGFLVLLPEGTIDNTGKTHWNVGWGTSTVNDVGFIETLLDELELNYHIDDQRIYSTGMSNGGFMSYLLACELSHKIAAIASVTGSMNIGQKEACNPDHPMPVMQIHGTNDAIVPYDGVNGWIISVPEIVEFWKDKNDANETGIVTEIEDVNTTDLSTVVHTVYGSGQNGVEIEHYKVIDGGHTWPGSMFNISGTNQDFDASEAIWNFFSQYNLDGKMIVGTADVTPTELSIYPSPAKDQIYINGLEKQINDFRILNIGGLDVTSQVSVIGRKGIDISKLNNGFYVIQIERQALRFIKD